MSIFCNHKGRPLCSGNKHQQLEQIKNAVPYCTFLLAPLGLKYISLLQMSCCSRNNTASIHTSIDDSVFAWQGEKLRVGTGTSPTKLCLRKRYVLLYDRQSSCGCIRGGGTLSDHEVLTCACQITPTKNRKPPYHYQPNPPLRLPSSSSST